MVTAVPSGIAIGAGGGVQITDPVTGTAARVDQFGSIQSGDVGVTPVGTDKALAADMGGGLVLSDTLILQGLLVENKLTNFLLYALITGGSFTETLDVLRQDIASSDPTDLVSLG